MSSTLYKISVHHIGGRSGTRAYPFWIWLEQDIENVLYDADPSCLEQIKGYLGERCIVLPYCIGATDSKTEFNLTYDRYESSLLTCLQEFKDLFIYNEQFSFDTDPDAHKTVQTIPVTLRALDTLFPHDDPPVTPPHFLSMDTEGSEYDILTGASRLLRESIHGVFTEFTFQQRFVGQKTLQDLINLLSQHGFILLDITHSKVLQMSHCRPIGLRGARSLASGDALFLKSPDRIVADHLDPLPSLLQAAITGLVFNQLEYTLSALDMLQKQDGIAWLEKEYLSHAQSMPNYMFILQNLLNLTTLYPPLTPIRFTQLFPTPEMAALRFAANSEESLGNCAPSPYQLEQAYYTQLGINHADFKRMGTLLLTQKYFGIEEFLHILGMEEMANGIRTNRLQHIKGLLQHMGLMPIGKEAE